MVEKFSYFDNIDIHSCFTVFNIKLVPFFLVRQLLQLGIKHGTVIVFEQLF